MGAIAASVTKCDQKATKSLAEICTYLVTMYGSQLTECLQEEPITLESDDRAQIEWMQRLFQESMILWISNPLTREQISGKPIFTFTEALLNVSSKHRNDMKILDVRLPTHLLTNVESEEETELSSGAIEGRLAASMFRRRAMGHVSFHTCTRNRLTFSKLLVPWLVPIWI